VSSGMVQHIIDVFTSITANYCIYPRSYTKAESYPL